MHIHQKETVKHIRSFLDENIVLKISGDPKTIPFSGVHQGIDGVDRFFNLVFSFLEVPANHDHRPHYRYIAQGNEVVAWGESWIHPIGKPMDTPMQVTNLFQFQRRKLVLFADRFDTESGAKIIAHLLPESEED